MFLPPLHGISMCSLAQGKGSIPHAVGGDFNLFFLFLSISFVPILPHSALKRCLQESVLLHQSFRSTGAQRRADLGSAGVAGRGRPATPYESSALTIPLEEYPLGTAGELVCLSAPPDRLSKTT